MTTLSDRLQRALQDKNLTQEGLAKLVGVSQAAIQKIVVGDTKKPRNLLDIANALQVDPNWLQKGVGDMNINHSMIDHSQINHQGQQTNNFFATASIVENDLQNSSRKKIGESVFNINQEELKTLEIINDRLPHLFEALHFSDDGLIDLLRMRSANNVQMITMFNESMSPLIEKHDLLFIDRAYTKYAGEGVYLLVMNKELYVRRLKQTPEGILKVVAINELVGESFDIVEAESDKVIILGKCLRKISLSAKDL